MTGFVGWFSWVVVVSCSRWWKIVPERSGTIFWWAVFPECERLEHRVVCSRLSTAPPPTTHPTPLDQTGGHFLLRFLATS